MEVKINIVERFQEWLQEEGKATKTIESYITDVKLFQQYLVEKDADPEVLLTRFYFTSYLKQLEKECLAIATINKKINSLKVYNDWLIQEKIVSDSVIRLKRDRLKIANGSEAEVSVLTSEQVDALLFHGEKESDRNKLIYYLLLFTGVRVSELVNLKLTDVDRLTIQLSVRGKGGKFRDIPLRKDVLEVLEQYVSGERAASKFASGSLSSSQPASRQHAQRRSETLFGANWAAPRLSHSPAHAAAHLLHQPAQKRGRFDHCQQTRRTRNRQHDCQTLHPNIATGEETSSGFTLISWKEIQEGTASQ